MPITAAAAAAVRPSVRPFFVSRALRETNVSCAHTGDGHVTRGEQSHSMLICLSQKKLTLLVPTCVSAARAFLPRVFRLEKKTEANARHARSVLVAACCSRGSVGT